jgi:hypoxanthine phosphoribosyltransferase
MKFNSIIFEQDQARYIVPSWQDLDQLSFELAQKIIESGKEFDLVVALAKGAWPMSRTLVDYLAISTLVSLGVRFYSGINERLSEPAVYQDLPVSVVDKKILLFDEVADTGESLVFASDYLLEQGASEVKTATLFFKERSAITPDYYASTTNSWIIFPFEVREMMVLLASNWREQGIDEEEISNRFNQLNFKKHISSYFLKINNK